MHAGNPYADQYGAFGDNVFRFSLLSMAACEAPLQLNIGGYRRVQFFSVSLLMVQLDHRTIRPGRQTEFQNLC